MAVPGVEIDYGIVCLVVVDRKIFVGGSTSLTVRLLQAFWLFLGGEIVAFLRFAGERICDSDLLSLF